MQTSDTPQFRSRIIAMILSVAVSILLMAAKFFAYRITGSAAILSDALESIINVVASGFALWSVVLASMPPDRNHPYGHGKIEFFSAGFEGALIILAAIGIFWEAGLKILSPEPLQALGSGLWLLGATSAVNFVLGLGLLRVGRKAKSPTITADGKHILTDVYTSAGVILGLVLVSATGWYILDGVIAIVVGANIIFTGFGLVRESYGHLMHESEPELIQEICSVLTRHRKPIWIDVHRLRTWRAGNLVHIDFHLILPRDMSIRDAHAEVKAIQAALLDHFEGLAEVLVHIDPCCEPDECPTCGVDPCGFRKADNHRQPLWTSDRATANRSYGTLPAGDRK